MITLYEFGDSPCCMKVRIALEEKSLPFERRFVTSWKFDHYQPEYQVLNPLSLVPTLVDTDGTIVIQSNVILEYLDQKYPQPRLIPEEPVLAAKVREWMVSEQDYLFPAVVTMSFHIMMKLRVDVFGIDTLKSWSGVFPDQEKARDYLRRVIEPIDARAIVAAETQFCSHLARLEAELSDHDDDWICGSVFTMADICLAGIMDRVEYLAKPELYEDFPRLNAWYTKIKTRAAFQKGVHTFGDRMWGPLKTVADYPFAEQPKFTWGYWN